jgi:hypothetical protein
MSATALHMRLNRLPVFDIEGADEHLVSSLMTQRLSRT